AHRSRSDTDRAQRRRSVHGVVQDVAAPPTTKAPVTRCALCAGWREPAWLSADLCSATNEHFLSPRAPSAVLLDADRRNLDARAMLVADSVRLTEKLEMLRKARERTGHEE